MGFIDKVRNIFKRNEKKESEEEKLTVEEELIKDDSIVFIDVDKNFDKYEELLNNFETILNGKWEDMSQKMTVFSKNRDMLDKFWYELNRHAILDNYDKIADLERTVDVLRHKYKDEIRESQNILVSTWKDDREFYEKLQDVQNHEGMNKAISNSFSMIRAHKRKQEQAAEMRKRIEEARAKKEAENSKDNSEVEQ